MLSGYGGWYWEVVSDGDNVIVRGVADDEPTAMPSTPIKVFLSGSARLSEANLGLLPVSG
jgi:hypothetical protein